MAKGILLVIGFALITGAFCSAAVTTQLLLLLPMVSMLVLTLVIEVAVGCVLATEARGELRGSVEG